MPMPNFHSARVRNPGDFQQDSFRNKTLPKSEGGKGGVQIVMGRLKGETEMTAQAYRFPADKYTPAEAKAWLKENDVKYISFEEATGEKESVDHAIETIRHEGDKWVLYSKDGSKKLGEFDTEEEAKKREQEIQAFKHMEAIYYEVSIEPRAIEAEGAQFEGREWDVTLIGPKAAGDLVDIQGAAYLRSQNGRLYNLQALAESAPAWEGVKVYDNHLTDEEFRERAGMRSVAREWIGSIVKPRWDGGKKQLRGVLKIVEESVARKLKNAWDAGILKTVGLSIDTLTIPGQEAVIEGRPMPTVEGFQKILSVDLVAEPAAGGGFNRLIAAQTYQEAKEDMTEDEVRELIANTLKETLPGAVTEALAEQRQEEAESTPPEAEPAAEAETEEETTEEAQEAEAPEEEAPAEAPATETAPSVQEQVRRLECKILLRDKLDAAKLDAAHRGVVESIFDGRVFEEAELSRVIEAQKKAQAATDPSGRVTGAGQHISVGLSPEDIAELEFFKLAMGHSDFRGLESLSDDFVQERVTESYKAWQKAGRPSNIAHGRPIYRLSEWVYELLGGNPMIDDRASEAVTTSGMSSIVKNAVNIMLAADYAKRHRWWEPLVRTEEVDTIDQATLVRVYGVNTLSVVDEGQAYTELSWADEEETASFVKKGNYVGVTLESLLRDKVNVIRRLPMRLSTSWYNTIGSLVSGVFTVNTATGPVLADTGALFNATAVTSASGHANLLTTALSFTSFGSARTAMRKQTDQTLGTGQRLLIEPRFLLVPTDLESAALQIRNSEYEPGTADNDRNPYYQKFEVVEVPDWTDTDNWALVGDPMEFPAIWLIFMRGQRVPSIFTAGDETSGAMFTNDTLRYKVRMLTYRFSSTYECAPVSDFRPLHKSNV